LSSHQPKAEIIIPEGMRSAVRAKAIPGGLPPEWVDIILEEALLWQFNNAPVPTPEQISDLERLAVMKPNDNRYLHGQAYICSAWVRRMYDAQDRRTEEKQANCAACAWERDTDNASEASVHEEGTVEHPTKKGFK